MSLKLLQERYSQENFESFVEEIFEVELIDTRFKSEGLTKQDLEHIDSYKYIGRTRLSDKSRLGFFVFKSKSKNIEKKRVGFNAIIPSLTKKHIITHALVAIYHEKSDVWRLSYVSFNIKDGKQSLNTSVKRYTYELGEEIPIKTAKSQIGLLLNTSSITKRLLEEVFSVEKLSNEFFREYKILYKVLVENILVVIKENRDEIQKESHAILKDELKIKSYIKKMLGRIVFLYFVQKKNWLNEEKKFLSNLFNKYTEKYPKENFYDKVLEQLFIHGLNQSGERWKAFDGQAYDIPYLNGGLFDADTEDKLDISIPNDDLEKVFDLFDSYNFTIIEDTPHDSEVAIDPEMLGRVFEDLLEDRKEKGAFYTPREIVHYMCQQSIENYMETKPKEISSLEYIKQIKILDPAIGSGAFPMGMLHEIVEMRVELEDKKDEIDRIAKIKREVIQNSIYGVDIEPSAVEIAKLRFWLSIVVDEENPQPLPNLLYKIMVGNSLVETIDGFDPLAQHGNNKDMKSLKENLYNFYEADTNEKKQEIQDDIEETVDNIFTKVLEKREISRKKIIKENDNLFETNKKLQNKIVEYKKEQELISSILEEYKNNRYTTELFLYKIYFKDVIDRGGFDIVIGNPPYVRHEKIKELKPKLEIEGYKSYNGTADLYIYFFEQGYRLLKENGSLSYITSNKYTRAKYGKQFREFILKNATILEYIDFNGVKVFESATVDTSIFSFRKSKEKKSSFLYCDINEKYRKENELGQFVSENGFEYLQNDLSVDSFSFSSPEELAIKKKVEQIGIPLKDWDIKINSGLKTGFNEAFIIDNKTKEELVAKNAKNLEIIQPLLRGKDIKKYGYEFANKWVLKILYKSSTDIAQNYSDIYNWLLQFEAKLKNKAQVKRGDHHWLELDNNPTKQTFDEFKKEKIIYSEIVQKPQFTLDTKSHCIDMTAFTLSGNGLKYLIALLNSKPVTYIFKQFYMGTELGTKGYRYKKAFLNLLPIPKIPKQQQKLFEILVDYILFAKEQNLSLESSLFESVIDGMVYDLYFEEEMKRGDCFISDEVISVLKEFDNTMSGIEEMYKIFKANKDIQRGLIYRRVISVVRVINGDK